MAAYDLPHSQRGTELAIPLRDNAPKGAEPVVTPAIIGVCVLVFGLQCQLHRWDDFGGRWRTLASGTEMTIIGGSA